MPSWGLMGPLCPFVQETDQARGSNDRPGHGKNRGVREGFPGSGGAWDAEVWLGQDYRKTVTKQVTRVLNNGSARCTQTNT